MIWRGAGLGCICPGWSARITKDSHYAINEDGSEYDDDVGGPAYVAGHDGVDLDPLSAEQDAAAKKAAQGLFKRIQQAAAAEPAR